MFFQDEAAFFSLPRRINAQDKGAAGWRRLVAIGRVRLAMRLRRGDDDHRSGLAWTRRLRMARNGTRRRNRTRSRARRRGTRHDGRVGVFTIMVMVVVVMAAEGGEGQGAGNQQSKDFTHGHVSFCCGGNDNGWIRFCVFSLSLPTNITGERDFLIYFIKKIIIERKTGQMGQMG